MRTFAGRGFGARRGVPGISRRQFGRAAALLAAGAAVQVDDPAQIPRGLVGGRVGGPGRVELGHGRALRSVGDVLHFNVTKVSDLTRLEREVREQRAGAEFDSGEQSRDLEPALRIGWAAQEEPVPGPCHI
jgi:hypothetical protein